VFISLSVIAFYATGFGLFNILHRFIRVLFLCMFDQMAGDIGMRLEDGKKHEHRHRRLDPEHLQGEDHDASGDDEPLTGCFAITRVNKKPDIQELLELEFGRFSG
jgi:hypothetical protein